MSTKPLTIGETARRGMDPKWYSSDNYSAHLLADGDRTMCGYTLKGHKEVPAWHRRCGNCKTKLRKLLDAALEPSPAFVREKVMITVTRPVKENLEDLSDALRRKMRANTTWTVELDHLETEIIQSQSDDEPEVAHHRNCAAYHDDPCDCGAEL